MASELALSVDVTASLFVEGTTLTRGSSFFAAIHAPYRSTAKISATNKSPMPLIKCL